MAKVGVSDERLKKIIKEAVKEVLDEELGFLKNIVLYVSDDEMYEIEDKHGTPDKYNEKEFIDKTKWVKGNENII